ncbi:hypothetical protein DY926_16415 [Komagataeibacter melaceti]|uniref:Lytic transglycosylase domain-containing protein n=1 Tax=Komagataeibacter melaceti TaxID=2766577 RepID=A0A371YW58_9PROT|nr:hypothetical protein [Komagataeibacter melaceti]RFD18478.1 hypothetical protein DY926_16415 [Komagataeibacter melaceti]
MSGLCLAQLKRGIIAPALAHIGLGGDAAVNLLAGTALVESGLAYTRQIHGPALGLWQMEPATHDDIWATFLPDVRLSLLRGAVLDLAAHWPARLAQLAGNLPYACAMARLKYYRAPEPLPAATDAAAMCRMWKGTYNSNLGAGAADARHVALFQQAIGA